jgi:HPt (histidine-containing phosphotransfer) domain-containing protein
LAEGKLDDAIREAHTVKGLAGQMGARELSQAAGRLETALRSASPETDTALRCFAVSLALVTRGLTEFAEGEACRESQVSEDKTARPLAGNEVVDNALP